MRNAQDVTDYYLFYAMKSLRGLKKMKEAMWSGVAVPKRATISYRSTRKSTLLAKSTS